MSEPRGIPETAIGVYRLTRDPRVAFYWIAGIVFVPLAATFVSSLFDHSTNGGAGILLLVWASIAAFVGLRPSRVLEILVKPGALNLEWVAAVRRR